MVTLVKKKIDGFYILYRKNTVDENVLEESFKKDIFLRPLNYKIKKNDIIIDVGAYIGTFSLLASSKAPEGTVYAIEPCLDNFKILKKNIELNKSKNIICANVALGKIEGAVKLFHNAEDWGHSTTKKSEEYEIVKMISLNNFFINNNIDRCNFMKMNCEGAEFEIMLNTPSNYIKKIEMGVILYHNDKSEGYKEDNLIEYLEENNFKVLHRRTDSTRGWLIFQKKPLRISEEINFYYKKLAYKLISFCNYLFSRTIEKFRTQVKRKHL